MSSIANNACEFGKSLTDFSDSQLQGIVTSINRKFFSEGTDGRTSSIIHHPIDFFDFLLGMKDGRQSEESVRVGLGI